MAYTLVSSFTVPASPATTTITFSNIPQTGRQILIMASSRDDNARFFVNLNSDATNAYNTRGTIGNSSTVTTTSGTNVNILSNSTSFTSNTFSNSFIMIGDHTNSRNKPFASDSVTETNGAAGSQNFQASWSNSTAAVTSVTLSNTTFSPNTFISLYIVS